MCFRDMETVRLTKYVDSCCHVLEEAIQQPTDVYLVKSVRLQQKAEHISEILYSKDPCITPVMSAPMAMAISSLEKEVVELGLALPPDIPQACAYSNVLYAPIFLSFFLRWSNAQSSFATYVLSNTPTIPLQDCS